MFLKTYRVYLMGPLCLMFAGQPAKAQTDSLFLSVDQLFERGCSIVCSFRRMRSKKPWRKKDTDGTHIITARSASGIERRFVGQPVVWERGLSGPTYPDIPDWSQNYAIDFPNHCIKVARFGGLSIRQRWKTSCRVADINRPGGNQTWFAEPIHESVQPFQAA